MNRIIRLFTIGILSVIIFGIVSPQDVLACSGGRVITIEEQVEYATHIVSGYIIEVDDYHSNAIMRVNQYLKGAGAEYILLGLDNPENILFREVRNSGGGCDIGVTRMNIGDEITIFLYKQMNGSYNLATRNRIFGNPDYFTDEIIDTKELANTIEILTGESSKSPIENMPYPLTAPLLIITELGSDYIIPVDGSEPVAITDRNISGQRYLYNCWEINCRAWSPNGLDSATIKENGFIEVYRRMVSGEGVLFPPIQDLVTIWDTTSTNVNISIYRFTLFPDEPFNPVARADLKINSIYPNSGAWSPNGRLLAFADSDGIYLWDVFTPNSQPELLITTNIKTIQGFSPLGTYLVVGNDENGFTIDLINKNIYPAGVFSPDESSMITYENAQQIYFQPNSVHETGLLFASEIHWLDNRRWVIIKCEDVNTKESCQILYGGYRGLGPSIRDGRIFQYNPDINTSVIVLDDFQIAINKNFDNLSFYFDNISDLSPYLDSPIASIEWLPSLFYYDD